MFEITKNMSFHFYRLKIIFAQSLIFQIFEFSRQITAERLPIDIGK